MFNNPLSEVDLPRRTVPHKFATKVLPRLEIVKLCRETILLEVAASFFLLNKR